MDYLRKARLSGVSFLPNYKWMAYLDETQYFSRQAEYPLRGLPTRSFKVRTANRMITNFECSSYRDTVVNLPDRA